MIIIDLSQVMLSNLHMQIGNHTNAKIEENMIRHMVLNSLRSYKVKFGEEYGEMVIACDNTNYWRKQLFPYYKANRKKNQEKSEMDWNSIFECLNKIRAELKEFFPYRVIDIESAEADDIIATLVKEMCAVEDILILSGDKDFIQLHTNSIDLHTYQVVKQYDPIRKRWITHDNPSRYLQEHILKGDSGDGIPNVLSSDNCFVVGERQKPLTQKKIDAFIEHGIESIARNYMRNKHLIDLSMIPENISAKILESYNLQGNKDRSKMFNYFIDNKLKNLMETIGEF